MTIPYTVKPDVAAYLESMKAQDMPVTSLVDLLIFRLQNTNGLDACTPLQCDALIELLQGGE